MPSLTPSSAPPPWGTSAACSPRPTLAGRTAARSICSTRRVARYAPAGSRWRNATSPSRSEEHTSELQSQSNLVCRLLLEKKKQRHIPALYLYSYIELVVQGAIGEEPFILRPVRTLFLWFRLLPVLHHPLLQPFIDLT